MFSSRLPAHLEANALARALAGARSARRRLIDLTVSNPAHAGITYPAAVFQPLAKPDVSRYLPEPFGLRSAREAVVGDYRRRGLETYWERIVLTASTSEAYSLLFKLLCAPSGDVVLVPTPSYPLFEHLTALDGVAAVPYRLEYDGRWQLDLASVDEVWDPRTRAVLAVSPNNPTGSLLSAAEARALATRCRTRDAALIVDEVFADYMLDASHARPRADPVPSPAEALTFRLGGLSKSAALPQMKLGWIAIDGPGRLVDEALERLELICDTYLSVSTPVQVAAPDLIAAGSDGRQRVRDRIRGNYVQLLQAAEPHPSIEVLTADAGWSAVLRIPSRGTEEQFMLDLLEHDGVVVHPGFFFDFPREAYLIVSLLPDPGEFREGIARLLERADA
jgi:aspartate/methionine/tyrosine aminotransferase